MRIIFFGTPDFAVASLKAILHNHFDVAAVVTAPDKPAGRGMKAQSSPVKTFAVSNNLPVLQPTNLKDPAFQQQLKSFGADLQVVIAFRMLPEAVWNMPKLGTVNLHGSLLPNYRGAAPINWAIINGEHKTGVSTFFLKHEIDTGDLIASATCDIGDDMTAGELHDLLMEAGAQLMVKTLQMIEAGEVSTTPQIIQGIPKSAPKIFTEQCRINWESDGEQIRNLIRGLSPYPAAFTYLSDLHLKIFRANFIPDPNIAALPGTLKPGEQSSLQFACKNGWIEATELQAQGKRRMTAREFMNGYRHI